MAQPVAAQRVMSERAASTSLVLERRREKLDAVLSVSHEDLLARVLFYGNDGKNLYSLAKRAEAGFQHGNPPNRHLDFRI